MQIGQDQRQGVGTRRDGKPRQRNSRQDRVCSAWCRQTFRLLLAEFDQNADESNGLVRNTPDSKATDLDQPGKRRGRAHQQPPAHGLDMSAVVGHEPREWDESLPRRLQQRQRET